MAQLERDAALGRLSLARRWLIVAAAGLTAGFAALVSAVAPGRTSHARTGENLTAATATPSRAPSSARMPPLASPSALGLQGPAQAPAPAENNAAPPASSGGSQGGSPPVPDPSASAAAPAPAPVPAPAPAPAVSGGS